MLSSGKRTKKIKKSDEIIVVAKTPIEEIIKETTAAKEVKKAIKKLIEKKETIEAKVKDVKKKISSKASELYAQAMRLIANVSSSSYAFNENKVDYAKLFSYLGEDKSVEGFITAYEEAVAKAERFKRDALGEREIVQEDELMVYLRKFMLNKFVGQDMNDIPAEQKERMNYYTLFNKQWVMMKIPLLGLAEKTYHAPRDN